MTALVIKRVMLYSDILLEKVQIFLFHVVEGRGLQALGRAQLKGFVLSQCWTELLILVSHLNYICIDSVCRIKFFCN